MYDIWVHVFQFLPIPQLLRIASVCQEFNQIVDHIKKVSSSLIIKSKRLNDILTINTKITENTTRQKKFLHETDKESSQFSKYFLCDSNDINLFQIFGATFKVEIKDYSLTFYVWTFWSLSAFEISRKIPYFHSTIKFSHVIDNNHFCVHVQSQFSTFRVVLVVHPFCEIIVEYHKSPNTCEFFTDLETIRYFPDPTNLTKIIFLNQLGATLIQNKDQTHYSEIIDYPKSFSGNLIIDSKLNLIDVERKKTFNLNSILNDKWLPLRRIHLVTLTDNLFVIWLDQNAGLFFICKDIVVCVSTLLNFKREFNEFVIHLKDERSIIFVHKGKVTFVDKPLLDID